MTKKILHMFSTDATIVGLSVCHWLNLGMWNPWIQRASCRGNIPILMAAWHDLVWMYHNVFNHSHVDEHLIGSSFLMMWKMLQNTLGTSFNDFLRVSFGRWSCWCAHLQSSWIWPVASRKELFLHPSPALVSVLPRKPTLNVSFLI